MNLPSSDTIRTITLIVNIKYRAIGGISANLKIKINDIVIKFQLQLILPHSVLTNQLLV